MDAEERDKLLMQGERMAWNRILRAAITSLGVEGNAERWRLERESAIATLREVCEDFGDNDWDESLHLTDIIDKHLARHLHEQ